MPVGDCPAKEGEGGSMKESKLRQELKNILEKKITHYWVDDDNWYSFFNLSAEYLRNNLSISEEELNNILSLFHIILLEYKLIHCKPCKI